MIPVVPRDFLGAWEREREKVVRLVLWFKLPFSLVYPLIPGIFAAAWAVVEWWRLEDARGVARGLVGALDHSGGLWLNWVSLWVQGTHPIRYYFGLIYG